jgi:NADH dehydrogenase
LIFIAGATGFVGGHLIDDLLSQGQKIKCIARSERAKKSLTARGVEVIIGDITLPDTLKGILQSEDFVIHLVGIITETGKSTFKSIHVDGTTNLVNEAKRAGVRHFFYQSALGADKNSWSGYLKTKAEAEDLVKNSGLNFTIFRPSLIIGPWDGFTKKLVDIIKISPVLPIPGKGTSRFQPIYIKDWLKCMRKVIDNTENYHSTYEIGGPEYLTYREITEILSESMGRRKTVFTLPMGLMKLAASLFESLPISPPVTSDQLRLLESDNICDLKSVEDNFDFKPVKYRDALNDFITDTF